MKEHLPASLRACSGVIALVRRCVCSCVEMCSTRSRQGEIVIFSASQLMSTPWILWDGSGGCRLDFFMWKPRIELSCSKVENPDWAVLVGSMDP